MVKKADTCLHYVSFFWSEWKFEISFYFDSIGTDWWRTLLKFLFLCSRKKTYSPDCSSKAWVSPIMRSHQTNLFSLTYITNRRILNIHSEVSQHWYYPHFTFYLSGRSDSLLTLENRKLGCGSLAEWNIIKPPHWGNHWVATGNLVRWEGDWGRRETPVSKMSRHMTKRKAKTISRLKHQWKSSTSNNTVLFHTSAEFPWRLRMQRGTTGASFQPERSVGHGGEEDPVGRSRKQSRGGYGHEVGVISEQNISSLEDTAAPGKRSAHSAKMVRKTATGKTDHWS